MDRVQLLNECRGDMHKIDFASEIGISLRFLNALYAGTRNPGRRVLGALLKKFPDRQADILDVFLPENKSKCSQRDQSIQAEA